MIYPIDPRPLPAAWLRVWRSLGLDVSGLAATPERGTGGEVEIPAQEKNPRQQTRTPSSKQARFNRAVSAPRNDQEREWAAEQDAQEARRRAHLAAQVKAQRAEQDRVRTAQAAARENANNGGRWAALELD